MPGIHPARAVPRGPAWLLPGTTQSPHQPPHSGFVAVILECLAVGMSELTGLEGFLNQHQTLKSTTLK